MVGKNWAKRLVVLMCGGVVVGFAIYSLAPVALMALFTMPTNDRGNHNPAKQQEMLKIILQVGDLALIPKDAKIKHIKTEGNMFTRSFRLAFDADPATINKWLADSRGISKVKVTKSGTVNQYVVNPKDGYKHAEVNVDTSKGRVTVYVSWS